MTKSEKAFYKKVKKEAVSLHIIASQLNMDINDAVAMAIHLHKEKLIRYDSFVSSDGFTIPIVALPLESPEKRKRLILQRATIAISLLGLLITMLIHHKVLLELLGKIWSKTISLF